MEEVYGSDEDRNIYRSIEKGKGLTQKELAEQIGISDKTVSKWETGVSHS